MQQHTLNGAEYLELEGEIEAIGSSNFSLASQLFPHVRFRDGRLVRNIAADNATAPYIDTGSNGSFYFRKWGSALVLLGTAQRGIGYRAADADYWRRYPRRNLSVAVAGFLMAAFLAYWAPRDGIGFAIAAMFPLAFGLWGFWEYKKDSQLVALIHDLEAKFRQPAA